MLRGLRAQIVDIDAAVPRGRDDDDPHARHRRARGIGAVRRRRDQHDVAFVRLLAIAVIRADHQQTGELTLRAGVRLQRDGGEPGDLAERRLELAEDLRT